MMEKIYQISYMYEQPCQGNIDTTTTFTERSELSIGRTPAKAIKNWRKIMAKRGNANKAYIIEIKEYILKEPSEN